MLIEPGNHPFCDNIRYLMKHYAVSRTALSRLLNVSRLKIQDWELERGPAVLNYDTVKRICAIFNVTAEQLLDYYLDPNAPEKKRKRP